MGTVGDADGKWADEPGRRPGLGAIVTPELLRGRTPPRTLRQAAGGQGRYHRLSVVTGAGPQGRLPSLAAGHMPRPAHRLAMLVEL